MKLIERRIPAWTLPATIAVTAAAAIGGPALAGGGPDPLESERAKLGAAQSFDTTTARTRMVTPQSFERRGKRKNKLVYGQVAFDNPAGAQSSGGVRCPKRTQATGGGVLSESRVPGRQTISASLPFDGKDRNSDNDNGWIGVVDNQFVQDLQFGVYVICKKTR